MKCAPSGVRAHSTRGVAASTALFHETSIEDACIKASWLSSSTFLRSFLFDVAPGSVAHSVLSGRHVQTGKGVEGLSARGSQ